jgi:hypothetical protein
VNEKNEPGKNIVGRMRTWEIWAKPGTVFYILKEVEE